MNFFEMAHLPNNSRTKQIGGKKGFTVISGDLKWKTRYTLMDDEGVNVVYVSN